MGLLVGVFLMIAVKKAVILVIVAAVLVPIFMGLGWNYAWKKRAILSFVKRFPDAELRGAVDGQFVKVIGVSVVALFSCLYVIFGSDFVWIFSIFDFYVLVKLSF